MLSAEPSLLLGQRADPANCLVQRVASDPIRRGAAYDASEELEPRVTLVPQCWGGAAEDGDRRGGRERIDDRSTCGLVSVVNDQAHRRRHPRGALAGASHGDVTGGSDWLSEQAAKPVDGIGARLECKRSRPRADQQGVGVECSGFV